MKKKFLALFSALAIAGGFFSSSAALADTVTELDDRIWQTCRVVDEIMVSPDQSIPEEMLAKCKAIAIYPNVLKGAFIFGARFGKGVVVKKDEKTGQWGPVAFSTLGGGNFGFQIGGSATDIILVIMNENGVESLLKNNFTMGGDAAAVAGPVGRDTQGSTDLFLQASILAYSRSRGLFAGVSLDGTVLTQDNESNTAYYGKSVTSRDILLGGAVEPKPSSQDLLKRLTDYATRWGKRLASRPRGSGLPQ